MAVIPVVNMLGEPLYYQHVDAEGSPVRAGRAEKGEGHAKWPSQSRHIDTVPVGSVVEEPPMAPARFTLDSLRDGRLRVVEPIEVIPMVEGGKYVAEAPEINEFGFGDTLVGAVADLQAAIAELYFTLEAEQLRLGSDLASVWGTLSRKIHKADAASRP